MFMEFYVFVHNHSQIFFYFYFFQRVLVSLPKVYMRLHLVVLNSNCHTLDHIAKVSTSFCNIFDYLSLFTSRYTFVSSANTFAVLVRTLVKSLIYITNSSGPITIPCGMPLITFSQEDGFPSTTSLFVFCCLKMVVSSTICHLLFPRHRIERFRKIRINYVNSFAVFYYISYSSFLAKSVPVYFLL